MFDGLQPLIDWLGAFPLTSVGGMFWGIFTLTLIAMILLVARDGHGVSRKYTAVLALMFLLIVGTDNWREAAGMWTQPVTLLFYVVSFVTLFMSVAAIIMAVFKTR